MIGRMTPQARLREMERTWLAAERAVLENPNTLECMRETARKAVERLEGKPCPTGPQMTLPLMSKG